MSVVAYNDNYSNNYIIMQIIAIVYIASAWALQNDTKSVICQSSQLSIISNMK